MPRKNLSISAFFPCYNDSKTIGGLVIDALDTLKTLTKDYEVIVVNDGSQDESAKVLEGLSKKYKHLKVVTHKKNRGYGGALRSGFSAASPPLSAFSCWPRSPRKSGRSFRSSAPAL